LDNEIRTHFNEIKSVIKEKFSTVEVILDDISIERAILKLKASKGDYIIAITEIVTATDRKYSYYLLHQGQVIIGLDNSSDRKALQLKYGNNYVFHLNEVVPHEHSQGKKSLKLTEEKFFQDFIEILEKYL